MGTDAVFGREAVQPGSVGGNRTPVPPGESVPGRHVLGSADARNQDAVAPSWATSRSKRDVGLCVVCERQGGKGRKVAGEMKCSPHLIQDRRRARAVDGNAG